MGRMNKKCPTAPPISFVIRKDRRSAPGCVFICFNELLLRIIGLSMAGPVSALDTGYLCFFRPDTAERFLDIPDSTGKCFTSLASTVLLPKIDSISELQGKERGCRMPYFRKSEIVYAGIYLRVSVEDEKGDESNSITNQR